MLSRRKRHSSGGYLLLVGYSSQPSWFSKTIIFPKAGEGERGGGGAGTHWEYPYSFPTQGGCASLFLSSESWRGRREG